MCTKNQVHKYIQKCRFSLTILNFRYSNLNVNFSGDLQFVWQGFPGALTSTLAVQFVNILQMCQYYWWPILGWWHSPIRYFLWQFGSWKIDNELISYFLNMSNIPNLHELFTIKNQGQYFSHNFWFLNEWWNYTLHKSMIIMFHISTG